MKILTLNTWQERGPWQERWEVIFQGLQKMRPDIACFQELFNPSWASEVQKRASFSGKVFSEEPSGLVIYGNYPVPSWGIERLPQSSLEEYLRYVLWVEMELPAGKIFMVNTHLSWMLEDGPIRQKQTEQIVRLIEKKSPQGETILVGDLNAPPDSPEIKWLVRKGKFVDTYHQLHPADPGFSWDNRNFYAGSSFHKMPDRRIDYILVRNAGQVLGKLISCDLVFTRPTDKGIWATDHLGLLAEFKNQ